MSVFLTCHLKLTLPLRATRRNFAELARKEDLNAINGEDTVVQICFDLTVFTQYISGTDGHNCRNKYSAFRQRNVKTFSRGIADSVSHIHCGSKKGDAEPLVHIFAKYSPILTFLSLIHSIGKLQ